MEINKQSPTFYSEKITGICDYNNEIT